MWLPGTTRSSRTTSICARRGIGSVKGGELALAQSDAEGRVFRRGGRHKARRIDTEDRNWSALLSKDQREKALRSTGYIRGIEVGNKHFTGVTLSFLLPMPTF